MKTMFLPYKRTFDYSGVSSQKKFNLFFLIHQLPWLIAVTFLLYSRFTATSMWFVWMLLIVLSLFTRWLRDAGRTLWWLLCLFPIPGGIFVLILVCAISESNTKSVEYSQNQRNIS